MHAPVLTPCIGNHPCAGGEKSKQPPEKGHKSMKHWHPHKFYTAKYLFLSILLGPTWSLQDKPHKDPRQSSQRVNYIANNLRLTKLSTKRRQHSFTHKKKINLNSSVTLYSLKQKEWTATRGPYSVKWSNMRCLVQSLQLKTRSLLKHRILPRCLMPSLALDSRD